jgi:hypothetical protein
MNKVKPTLVTTHIMTLFLQRQVEPHQRVSYRFFPIPKDVFNLTYSMEKNGLVKDDDWANIPGQLNSWNKKWLIIYFQANDHENKNLKMCDFCVRHAKWLDVEVDPKVFWKVFVVHISPFQNKKEFVLIPLKMYQDRNG